MLERRDPALTQRRAFGGSGAVAPDGLIQKVNALDIDNTSSWRQSGPRPTHSAFDQRENGGMMA
jgi:hypothetical protein